MDSEMQRQPEPEFMDDGAEAEAYAHADFADVNRAFVERLLDLTDEHKKARALELGVGPGDITVRIAPARPGWHIVG